MTTISQMENKTRIINKEMNNMQQKIDLSKEAMEFLEGIKNAPEVTILPKTVEEIYEMYKDGKIKRNLDYNREYSWPRAVYKSYEFTLIRKSVVPAIIVRRVKWKNSFRYEVIDGGHRVETPVKVMDNNILLPNSILEELGGGGLYKDAHPDIQKAIRQSKIIMFDVGFVSDDEVSRIFCSLQNGQKLKPGQKIKGLQYGINAECINIGLKSRLWERLTPSQIKVGLHYSVLVQAMRFEASLETDGEIPRSKDYVEFVEKNELPTDKVLIKKVVNILDKLSDVLDGTVSNIKLQSLIRGEVWFLFVRQHDTENVQVLSEFFDRFYRNLDISNKIKDDDRTTGMKSYHNYNKLRYEDIGPFLEFFNKKFDLFKKGTLEDYTQSQQTKLN